MVEFRKCFSNFMISITFFNDLAVKNKFLLLKSSTLETLLQNEYAEIYIHHRKGSEETSQSRNKKGVRALRGYFGPLWSQKLKVAIHQFHLVGLLEE